MKFLSLVEDQRDLVRKLSLDQAKLHAAKHCSMSS